MGSCRASLPSVQEVVESALHKFVDNSNFSDVQLSSRTDSGVHAFGNTLHVDIENKRRKKNEVVAPHDPVTVQRALNSMLAPKGIGITSVSAVPPTFHARFDAKHRTYMYRLLVLPKNPGWRNCLFDLNNSWIVSPRRSTYLNVDVMRAAARPLLGNHDFTSFQNSGCQAHSAIKTLDVLDIHERRWTTSPASSSTSPFDNFRASSMGLNAYVEGSSGNVGRNSAYPCDPGTPFGEFVGASSRVGGESSDEEVQELLITVRARSFLYNQVRNMVGFLAEVGDDTSGDQMKAERNAKRILGCMDRCAAPKKAPAHGLHLMQVGY